MKNKYRKMRFDVGMDVELNKHLQLKLFEEGYAWFGDEREFNNYGPYIYTDADGYISWGDNQKSFEGDKEYKHEDPRFYLVTTTLETEDLIEIL